MLCVPTKTVVLACVHVMADIICIFVCGYTLLISVYSGANELQRREEETWCPLCRASWNQGKSSTTPAQKLKYVCHISYACICMLIHFHNALCLVLHRKKITICKSLDVPCTPKPPNIGHPGDCISAAD